MPARKSSPAAASAAAGDVFVTRQVHFSASHRLWNPKLSEKENEEAFGHCCNEAGHGHNYVLEVTVAGKPDPKTGYVMNLRDLKRLIKEEVADPCDHKHLNQDVPFLKGVIPSTENLAVTFWRRIASKLKTGRLVQVRLYETPRNFADYYGP